MSASARFERFEADRFEMVDALCGRCLDDPPSSEELRDALYSEDQPAIVRGAPGVGIVATVCNGSQGYVRLLGVDPAARRQGHGSALLEAAERDLAHHDVESVQVGADPPYFLYPGVPSTATAMLCLLERHHYDRAEANINMEIDLEQLPPDPGGHHVARADERAEVADWMARHWPNWEAEALRALDKSTLLLSRDGDDITGFCAYGVNRQGLLGPIAVRGDLMGRGTGRPLLVGALHRMRATGQTRAEVVWVGPIRPYARLGGRVTKTFFVYRRRLG
jgi:GNAT superfamily N-acetyltransferase